MQRPQPLIPPQAFRLSITKFSHTTTLIDHVGPLTWNHVTGNLDLYCIYEKFFDAGSGPSKLIQKVIRGDGVLEQIDFVYFIQMVALEPRLIPPPKSHFAVVVKSPCIAVKYPYRGTHIRRFQLKFTTEHDYFVALTLLGEINCPLTEGNTPVPTIRRFPSISSLTSGDMSYVAPKTAHTMTTSHGSNGVRLHTGAIGSGGTTPIRASSPASTVSYPISRFGPPLPAVNRPTLNIEPTGMNQPLSGPVPFPDISHSEMEAPNSQLSAIHDVDQLNQMLPPKRDLPFSKSATKKPHSTTVAKTTQERPEAQSKKPSKDPEQVPPNAAMEPGHGLDFFEFQSQNLSQPAPFTQASQPLLLHEEPPRNPNPVGRPDDKQRQDPVVHAAPAITEEQLAEYLASPTSERIAFLENWMCELIEDDKFMTLCQDVEGTWRRFAFGQKP